MRKTNQFSLFGQRRFAPFFWTQFLGALNDNVFKTGVMTALTFDAMNWTTMDRGFLNNLIPGLFILPFVLFSAFAGQLADKFEKSRFIQNIKLLEIGIMLIAAFGWMTHNLWLLIAAVAGMGLHSALFGPAKYAYLPQKLAPSELTGGNGVVEMGTFVGILVGQISGAMLVSHQKNGLILIAASAIFFALFGWLCSRRIPQTPAPAPQLAINWNFFAETLRNLRFSGRNRTVFVAMLANSWFWFYGAIILAQFPVYTEAFLHGSYGIFVLLLSTFSLGVGIGSLWCERLSGRRVEMGLVPLGAAGLSLFGYDLYRASTSYTNTAAVDMIGFLQQIGSVHIVLDCLMIGVVGGIYIVPLFALIQTRCDPQHISRTIAGMNILNAIFMVAAALVAMSLLQAGLTIPQLFLVTAILNAVVTLLVFILVPEFMLRFVAWILLHSVRRIACVQEEPLPENGAALLICNQASPWNAVAMLAVMPRPVRLVIDQRLLEKPLLSWLLRIAKAIPVIASDHRPANAEIAADRIVQALMAGELVCVFGSNGLGQAHPSLLSKTQINDILKRAAMSGPVVPMALRSASNGVLNQISDTDASAGKDVDKSHWLVRQQLVVGNPLTVAEWAASACLDRMQ